MTSNLDNNMNLASVWEQIADARPEALALANGETSRSWAEYDDRAARLAGALDAAGIGAGDNVACALFNGNDTWRRCSLHSRYVQPPAT